MQYACQSKRRTVPIKTDIYLLVYRSSIKQKGFTFIQLKHTPTEDMKDSFSVDRFTTKQYCLTKRVEMKNKNMKIKTHTHNKTTKLRKFLLMKHNRNKPKFSTQTETIILSDFKEKSITSNQVLIFIQTDKSAIKTDL